MFGFFVSFMQKTCRALSDQFTYDLIRDEEMVLRDAQPPSCPYKGTFTEKAVH